ncbi:RCC1 domain-containing protein 1 isoform X5 [Myotis daubentonii]|uniref:RCC1 domain-containing protein 1 isoform X5 n=1 Tax=Myotis daubentonii TaxID=98922 RepID=UPI002872E4D7|nr:RCC1 domain-containing protein 1 isoform X5 [Myotis daubentonii]
MAAVQLCGQEGGALPVLQVQPRAVREVPVPSPAQPAGGRQRAPEAMAEERPGSWFGFGFCGFGQALGSGRGRQVLSPEPLCVPDAGTDICDVSAAWSYTAFVSRAGRVLLSGSAGGAADGCRDAWASESLLVVLRDGRGAGVGAELQAWAPGSALRGEPLWAQTVAPGAGREDGAGAGTRAGPLPLLPCARAYVSPRPPLYRPLAPELRARRLELGAEHALLLDEAGQVYSWGGGRHGQLGHGTLEAELAPRLLEALQGLRMAEVAAGGWHSLCVSETGDIYIWGWNESGQLALPARGLAEDGETVAGEATALRQAGSGVKGPAGTEEGAAAPFIAVQPFPALLDLPLGSDAVTASCGSRHTAVVTRTGELYTWGWGHPRLLTRTVAETPEHKQVSGRLLHRQIKGRWSRERQRETSMSDTH